MKDAPGKYSKFFAAICLCLAPAIALAQSVVIGEWAKIARWPIYPVNVILLPTGTVMFYPGDEGISGNDTRKWDPATDRVTTLAQPGYNTFCTGHSLMADGRLFVAGGHIANNVGLSNASIYNPFSNSWQTVANMSAGRWYPTATTLPTGDVLVTSGYMTLESGLDPLPQVFHGTTWRNLTNAQLVLPFYPWMFVAPNGKVFSAGSNQETRYLKTAGTGAWSFVANTNYPEREYGSAVLYDTGKILILGGGGNSTDDPASPQYLPTDTAEVIDLNSATPSWRSVSPMSNRRRHPNATLLPDGRVLVTGGNSGHGDNNLDYAYAVHAAEMWDPATETWTTMASNDPAIRRIYHSTALLLPDGRVLTSGGNSERMPEIYSPPYLFKGPRPTITAAPSDTDYAQTFALQTPDSDTIAQVCWIRLGAVTHGFNENQGYNKLNFATKSDTLTVTSPANSNLCPPGHYMLFIGNIAGVPSVAKIVRIGTPNPPKALSATAISGSQIGLRWIDNSSAEQGYKINRSVDRTTFTEIGTADANATTYSDMQGLSPGTLYYYRVRAYNSFGNSAYSAIASATTGSP